MPAKKDAVDDMLAAVAPKKRVKSATIETATQAKSEKKVAKKRKDSKTTKLLPQGSDSTGNLEKRDRRLDNPQTFKPGQSGNPKGRPKGSKNKLGEALVAALCDDFEEHGVEAIIAVREERPDVYLQIVSKIIPKDLNVNVGGAAFDKMWAAVNAGTLAAAATQALVIEHDEDDEDNRTAH